MLVFLLLLLTTNVFVKSFNDDFLFKPTSTESSTTTMSSTTITRSPQILLNEQDKCRFIPEYIAFRNNLQNISNNYRSVLQKQFDGHRKNLNKQLTNYCDIL